MYNCCMATYISREQYDAGLEFMLLNYPCSTAHDQKRCQGCEIDFQALLGHMDMEWPE